MVTVADSSTETAQADANIATRPADEADAKVWDIAATVNDPEIPVLSIVDLGILRAARATSENGAAITITPTYSGCPAMDTIRDDLKTALIAQGYNDVVIEFSLTPAWTTDWMTEAGKAKLTEYGIAAPTGKSAVRSGPIPVQLSIKCPHCDSLHTREVSRFGSTSCKALYVCRDCLEPFDYFKVH